MLVAHPDLIEINLEPKYVVRKGAPIQGKVALVSGGGSGHEPMHGGFVGRGMLDGACAGEVFTSPTPDQIYECTKRVGGEAGVVHIVKNYTGDVLNFEMAAAAGLACGLWCAVFSGPPCSAGAGGSGWGRGRGATTQREAYRGVRGGGGAPAEGASRLERTLTGSHITSIGRATSERQARG